MLTVRRLKVDLARGFGRRWLGGDACRTQFFNALSMSFPIGEQMFIDSVRAAPRERLHGLHADVDNFIGQEASHRHLHLEYNRQLERQGLSFVVGPAQLRRVRFMERRDVRSRLAVTAAFEHYTALLADGVLRRPAWLDGAEAPMRTLWMWHAAEETEHKSLAFDVYRALGGGYWRRVLWYLQVSFMFSLDTAIQTTHNLYRDGSLFKATTWFSGLKLWFGRQGLAWHMLPPMLEYLAPSFTPWQHDNRDLARHWLEQNAGAWQAVGRAPVAPENNA